MRRAVLLRAVNVGAGRALPMAALRAALAVAGLGDVQTVLQSGNLVVASDDDDASLGARVEAVIGERLGLRTRALVRSADELDAALAARPFDGAAPEHLHLTFLATEPEGGPVAWDAPPDAARRIGREVHVWCPGGYGRTRLHNAAIERLLGVDATTRNRATTARLRAMLDG